MSPPPGEAPASGLFPEGAALAALPDRRDRPRPTYSPACCDYRRDEFHLWILHPSTGAWVCWCSLPDRARAAPSSVAPRDSPRPPPSPAFTARVLEALRARGTLTAYEIAEVLEEPTTWATGDPVPWRPASRVWAALLHCEHEKLAHWVTLGDPPITHWRAGPSGGES